MIACAYRPTPAVAPPSARNVIDYHLMHYLRAKPHLFIQLLTHKPPSPYPMGPLGSPAPLICLGRIRFMRRASAVNASQANPHRTSRREARRLEARGRAGTAAATHASRTRPAPSDGAGLDEFRAITATPWQLRTQWLNASKNPRTRGTKEPRDQGRDDSRTQEDSRTQARGLKDSMIQDSRSQ